MTTKELTKDFCNKLDAAIDAAQENGVGLDDLDEGMAVGVALKAVIANFGVDKKGTALMLAADLIEMAYDEMTEA